jgi:hypothetical protein
MELKNKHNYKQLFYTMSEYNFYNRWGDLDGLPTAPHASIDDQLTDFVGNMDFDDDDSNSPSDDDDDDLNNDSSI